MTRSSVRRVRLLHNTRMQGISAIMTSQYFRLYTQNEGGVMKPTHFVNKTIIK